ncbi:hypothetical protein D3C84_1018620 [compost metagenome]
MQADLARRRGAPGAGRHLVQQRCERHRLAALQRALGLQRGEFHHAVDDLLDALRLAGDVGQEAVALGLVHPGLLQQLGGAADGRQRALDLVGEGLHVVGHVAAAGEGVAHLAQAAAQGVDRAPQHP